MASNGSSTSHNNNHSYDAIRATVQESGSDSRVEVNQRALIDKILARYASAGAVYRELLQNSNDAEASIAEIHFTLSETTKVVEQVLYRNNGMPFRPQDWKRLQKASRSLTKACTLLYVCDGKEGLFSLFVFKHTQPPDCRRKSRCVKSRSLWRRRLHHV